MKFKASKSGFFNSIHGRNGPPWRLGLKKYVSRRLGLKALWGGVARYGKVGTIFRKEEPVLEKKSRLKRRAGRTEERTEEKSLQYRVTARRQEPEKRRPVEEKRRQK